MAMMAALRARALAAPPPAVKNYAREAMGWIGAKTKEHPLAAAVLLCGVKTCAADVFVQKVLERHDVDWRRNFVFTAFGLGYLGGFQYFLYARWFPRWFPGKGMGSTLKCVAFDQTINTGVWYYPLFYVVQDGVMNSRMDAKTLQDGSARYCRNITQDMTNCWKLWVPAQLLNFSIVPLHWRAPFCAGVSLFWTCILSFMRGNMS
mmetsp:Transcript_87810/g.196273  ORF Transcript_87810/g.196273 Transcript_87810/m.196273 type:complete len:205 (-) Transcript_87810:173-787(-)